MRTRPMSVLLCLLLLPAWLLAGEGQFDSNGVRICYTDTGNPKGEPVFLVHGFAVNGSLQWTIPGITKALSNDYRLIIIDNRGHGRSGRPKEDGQYGMEMVHDLARLMDHLGIKKADFVGYSMGSFLTHKFAATYPERVKCMVLGGAGWLREGPATDAMDQISDSLRKDKSLEPLFRALHPADAPPINPERLAAASKLAMLINDPLALACVAKGMKELKLTEEEVKKINIPTLCIVGDRDPLADSARLLEGQRKGLTMCYIKKADHMNAFEKPEFRDGVMIFLKEQK
jgi:pimeloyl-ACP methyl ester carboxylesterase